MRKFVHSYLSASFEVKRTENTQECKITVFGFDAIFPKGEDQKSFIYCNRLIKELVLAAYIDEVRLRKFINEWVEINYPHCDLKVYWLTLEPETGFPQITRVAARTIQQELISVQPMDGPKGSLMYLDFKYNDNTDTPNRNGRVYNQEVFNENLAQLIRNQVNAMCENKDHDLPMALGSIVGVSSRRADKPEEIERQSWFNKKRKKKDLDNPE